MKHTSFQISLKGKKFRIASNYRKQGEETIIFIHGLGCTKESFNDAFKSKHLKEFSILIPDLAGFGDSSKPQDFQYRMEQHAGICKIILEKTQHKKAHIVAHSMGGPIGLLLAEEITDKLASYTNIEGNLISEDCGFISRRITSTDFKDFKNRLFEQIKADISKSEEAPYRLWLELINKADPSAFYRSAESLVKWSDSGKLIQKFMALDSRKLYVYGDRNSSMAVLEILEEEHKLKIPDSGHFVMNDNPKEFYEQLAKFLKEK